MSWVAVGVGLAGAAGAIYSSKKSGDASDSAAASTAEQIAWEKQQYFIGADKMEMAGTVGSALWQQGSNIGYDTLLRAQQQSAMYQTESADYKQKADIATQTMQGYFDNFLAGFDTMLNENASNRADVQGWGSDARAIGEANLADFNRTYGNIMDNVKQGIMDVSSAQLSATGREQLSLDMETLGKTFDNSMASRGMARSGMSVEADRRMAMDTAQQGRAIDVNANSQAMQLQGQGLQNLNGMYGIGQNIQQFNQNVNQGYQNMELGVMDQRMNILGQQGQANQAVGNTYGNMASQFYNTSASMFGQGFGQELQAANNLSNMYTSLGQSRLESFDSFYSGVGKAGGAGVSTALSNQATNYSNSAVGYSKDAAGWASLAGTAMGGL